MKNSPIIGKFLAVLSVFGLFAIASTAYSTAQMRGVQQGYEAVATGPLHAAAMVLQANRDLVSLRQDIAQLLIVNADAEDQAQLKAIASDRAALDTDMAQAADLSPANAAALLALKTQADAALDGECAVTVRTGGAATAQQQGAAAQQQYLNDCSPLFPPLAQTLTAIQSTLEGQAADAEAGLAASTNATAMLTFAIMLAGLLVIMAGGFVAIRQWLVRPITALQGTMRKLSAGDYTTEVGGADRKDEIGGMARAVQVFKEAGLEKIRLERESEDARAQAAELRRKADAEREAAAKQLQLVIAALANGLEKLSSGDLLFRLDLPFTAEYEKLRTDFNQAMERLLETMKAIAANTAGVRAGASEINQASDDLSRRTEQQAASLEQTAAALDQITATVKRAAESAKEARELVAAAKTDAERSGDVVREMIGAMSGIETSSRQIGNIIGVIDEIAFQTNLLALNAGVEAARAGDAGRGFAVVATEVRALAQRSAEAAKEIKALISASGQQVDSGVKLVGETGKALVRIVEQVGKLNHLVSAIAASAQEQSTALGEVNTAVNQMDQVTQRNAAMVEEATAASHNLAGEADELAQLVGQFQIGVAAEPRERPAPVRRMSAKPARPRPPARSAADKVVAFSRAGQASAAAGAFEDASEF